MNIFYLDTDPNQAAQYHCDKHVVKMILESAQLLCTACVERGFEAPYKSTHKNHPCSIWVRKYKEHWNWVYELMQALNSEWQYRYGHIKNHKSMDKLLNLKQPLLPSGWENPPLCMPVECKMDNPVDSYRKYYGMHKASIASYTKRDWPEWFFNV